MSKELLQQALLRFGIMKAIEAGIEASKELHPSFEGEPGPFKPDYDTEAVLVEEMQRMAKQLAEMQDWEAVASDQAMTIAMMKLEQEPVGYIYRETDYLSQDQHLVGAIDDQTLAVGTALYTLPPQRQPLTAERVKDVYRHIPDFNQWVFSAAMLKFSRAIEAAHGIGDKT